MTDAFDALPADVQQRRRTIRERALAARIAVPAEQRAALTSRLERQLDDLIPRLAPPTLGFCWPYRAEPDLRAWVLRWLAASRQRRAALPAVLHRDCPLVFREWTASTLMETDRHGIPHPAVGAEVIPDVVLVPLNAFDDKGFRLGYGGGYFDRTLAAHKMVAVGVGFELGRVATVHPQAHDLPMDWLVTETGWSSTCAAGNENAPGAWSGGSAD